MFTTRGFYSVVAHREDPDQLLVRARTREDLEGLRDHLPELEPFEDPAADYRWRAVVGRDEWRGALAKLADEIDYPNFKSAVEAHQGIKRSALYERIWSTLRSLQETATGP